ncbi:diaminopimelate decarboxylase [Abditibacterium utsteinense]|uniref:Diaminopimelate decarboxylase n=1 Tax=Abditibacterium utsteinense TaxID=1960156 RepID=A0A2S8SW35_9BACT|nr:diaminopimelate decarboxylase [Abditibacterium utsteinense]PQV65011.1 diaminopimelate decarboxylase [Abditibacterium utsteinense]
MFYLGTQTINSQGHLEIGGCDALELAQTFATPLIVMDEAHIRSQMRAMKAAFEAQNVEMQVIYASKAFPCLAISKIAAQEGLWIDVASAGELLTALRADFPAERIVFHGNNKSREELEMAVGARIGRVIVDNLGELEMLDEIAGEAGVSQPIMLRLTPAVDAHTHRLIQTGRIDTKFGFNIDGGAARRGVEIALGKKNLELLGVGCHIGSQILDAPFFTLAARLMVEFLAQIRDELQVEFPELDLGGGLGIRYLPEQAPPAMEDYAATLIGTVRENLEKFGLQLPILSIEPGRSLVGEAGTTLYSVGTIKEIPNVRTYVSVDGGLSDNPRPALYEAKYFAINASKAGEEQAKTVAIAGKHCETDVLIEAAQIANPERGDIIAVYATGAYNYSMASNYNRFRRPAVVLVSDGEADLIIERESLEDVLSHDLIPERLRQSEAVGV